VPFKCNLHRYNLVSSVNYRYGRVAGKHPSYSKLIQTLRVLRKPKTSKAADALAKGLGGGGGGSGGDGGGSGGGGGGLMGRLTQAGLTKDPLDKPKSADKNALANYWGGGVGGDDALPGKQSANDKPGREVLINRSTHQVKPFYLSSQTVLPIR
jgi:hypothetical protein